jgi:gamma-glutamyltranspeptidase/glutathione hydrolase
MRPLCLRTQLIPALLAVLLVLPARAQRPAVEARHGIVTSAHVLASQAGVEMLQRGGNAIDAAVATGLALAVVYPFAGNLGGGGFMLVHLADGRDTVIDYRECAPSAATKDMYLDAQGALRRGNDSSTRGWRASGVPGTVAGFAFALEKYGSGKLSWSDVCEPARRLAAEGVIVSQGTASNLRSHAPLLSQFEESKRVYLKNGELWQAGERWKQPDLAATFARLQQQGPNEFYEGETARLIAAAMVEHGGTLSAGDLKNYRVAERQALRGRYRGYDIVTMPPPSSGGIALLQMLAMLEPFDVTKLGPNSAAKDHLFAEVMRRAFADRSEYLGDPDFVTVPVSALLDSTYLKHRMEDFDPHHASRSDAVKPGLDPNHLSKNDPSSRPAGVESTETTHFSVVDAAGNAVSNTYTLNGGYGSGVTIPKTGILMNNEMDDFTSKIGAKNMFGLIQGSRNAIVPGKRPLSSMTPTFVLKDSRLFLVTGSPGGPTIINTVLQIITNVIDHGMPVSQAVEAPRIHHQWLPDVLTYEHYGMSPDTAAVLTAMGHELKERRSYEGAYQGDGETIMIDPQTGVRLGAADPRKPDAAAVGY